MNNNNNNYTFEVKTQFGRSQPTRGSQRGGVLPSLLPEGREGGILCSDPQRGVGQALYTDVMALVLQ